MMSLYILLDDIPSNDFPFCLTERPVIPGTQQQVDKQQLIHRDGSLTIKRGFLDRSITLEFNILEDENIKQAVREFKAYFFNKSKLQFSDDDVYYRINSVEISDFENEIEFYGTGSIKFDIEPFEYAVTNDIKLTSNKKIKNIGTYEARPKITIYGNGDFTVYFNSQKIELIGIKDFVVLDSEYCLAYKSKKEQMDHKMYGEFPIFDVGQTNVKWVGNISKIVIEPRWRYL